MKRATKKLDATVVKALKLVCEQAKADIHGFAWITHTADFDNFLSSLRIVCVFDTQGSLDHAHKTGQKNALINHIFDELLLTEEAGAEKRLLG
jgi:hypothetical protein